MKRNFKPLTGWQRCKLIMAALFFASPLALLFISGCSSESENAAITSSTAISVTLALDAWGMKGDKNQATLAAAQIVANAQAVKAYLAGSPGALGTEVQKTLNTDLLKGVDPIIAEAVQLASAILDNLMPAVPTDKLSTTQLGYINAFLDGCIAGAQGSSVGPASTAGTTRKMVTGRMKLEQLAGHGGVWFPAN